MSDLITRLQAAGHDDRLAHGPLYLEAAAAVERLQLERNQQAFAKHERGHLIRELRAQIATLETRLEELQQEMSWPA